MFFGLLMMVGVVLLVVVVVRAIGGGVRRGGTAEPARFQGPLRPPSQVAGGRAIRAWRTHHG